MVVSKEAMIYSYVFTFALLATVMTNVCQYFYWNQPKKADCWGRWGPFVLLSAATVLLLISPLKNLVVNVCMASFRENGFDSTIERALDIAYLPMFSTVSMQVYTSIAYILMIWGTGMQVDIGAKFRSATRRKGAKAMAASSS